MADVYLPADEGYGVHDIPTIHGDPDLSCHLVESLADVSGKSVVMPSSLPQAQGRAQADDDQSAILCASRWSPFRSGRCSVIGVVSDRRAPVTPPVPGLFAVVDARSERATAP